MILNFDKIEKSATGYFFLLGNIHIAFFSFDEKEIVEKIDENKIWYNQTKCYRYYFDIN